jgi:tetratricopeptide (TPR) repeat protein
MALSLRDRPWAVAAVIAMLLAVSVAAQAARLRAYPQVETQDRFLYIQSGETMKRLALSFDALAADIYWMRALQHYGGDRLSNRGTGKYVLLYPLLDLTTTLDPWFTIAYRFGAVFLSQPYPGGPGRPDLALALLKKGLRAQPNKWEYVQDAGFIYYWDVGDFETAAQWFTRASRVPGAPDWLVPLAANTLATGGDRVSSRFLWQQTYQSAQDDWLKREALRRLTQLTAMDQLDALNATVSRWSAAHPGYQITWEALVRAGVVRGIPVDPTGVPYAITASQPMVELSRQSRLWPLPRTRASAARVAPPR